MMVCETGFKSLIKSYMVGMAELSMILSALHGTGLSTTVNVTARSSRKN